MSMETGGVLDAVSEVGTDVPEQPSVPYYTDGSPDVPEGPEILWSDDAGVGAETLKGAESLIGAEATDALDVVNFAFSVIEFQEAETGNLKLFAPDRVLLTRLSSGLAGLSEPTVNVEEVVQSESPPISVRVGEIDIMVADADERVLLERAVDTSASNGLNGASVAEIKFIVSAIQAIDDRGLPGDDWYKMATESLSRDKELSSLGKPIKISDGATDISTGTVMDTELVPSVRESFSVKGERLSIEDRDYLERGLKRNPRAVLNALADRLNAIVSHQEAPKASTLGARERWRRNSNPNTVE